MTAESLFLKVSTIQVITLLREVATRQSVKRCDVVG
jgi:hypothetical protein